MLHSYQVSAQRHEIGLGLGASFYSGDMVNYVNPSFARPAGQIFYRNNISPVVALKGGVGVHQLHASDISAPRDALAEIRAWEFTTTLIDAEINFEYHFLNFRGRRKEVNWTPYFFTGLGAFFFADVTPIVPGTSIPAVQPMIPFGFGFKWDVRHNVSLGFQVAARYTFTDYLDGMGDEPLSMIDANNPPPNVTEGAIKDVRFGDFSRFDQYFFASFSISYIFYSIPCPYNFNKNYNSL